MEIVIIRHPRERKSKCSLEPLRGRPDLTFLQARPGWQFDASGFIQLAVDAPVLSAADAGKDLLLLDSTWRLLPQVEACVGGSTVKRSLPADVLTAFPRKSKVFSDPENGLASVEALYLALAMMGNRDESLLAHYHWKDEFLTSLPSALR